MNKILVIVFCILTAVPPAAAFNSNGEYTKALGYLNRKNEVYLCFPLPSRNIFQALSQNLSIDKIIDGTVYAYANKDEFFALNRSGIEYRVLLHPGDDWPVPPSLSDYRDIRAQQFDKYPATYTDLLNIITQFETNYPKLCKAFDFGRSNKGKAIKVLKISSDVTEHKMKPLFYGTATMHGDETLGFMLALNIINFLLTNYGKDPVATRIVDSIEVWIQPIQNPDGTFNRSGDAFGNQVRANAQGMDLNRNTPDPKNGNPSKFATETQLALDFEKQYNFVSSFDLHGGVEAIYTAWYCWPRAHPDKPWYDYVTKNFVDSVHKLSGNNYLKGPHGQGKVAWGELHGTRCDYQPYFRHCRELCCELHATKTLPENQIKQRWDWVKGSLLGFITETLNGIRGTVTDSLTGKGIRAKVWVQNHDADSSHVYSNPPYGDYYRLIAAGTYSLIFSCDDYRPDTVSDIKVENGKATIVNVKLVRINTSSAGGKNVGLSMIKISHGKNRLIVNATNVTHGSRLMVFDASGKEVCRPLLMNTSKTYYELPIPHMHSGMYIVQVKNGEKSTAQKMLLCK